MVNPHVCCRNLVHCNVFVILFFSDSYDNCSINFAGWRSSFCRWRSDESQTDDVLRTHRHWKNGTCAVYCFVQNVTRDVEWPSHWFSCIFVTLIQLFVFFPAERNTWSDGRLHQVSSLWLSPYTLRTVSLAPSWIPRKANILESPKDRVANPKLESFSCLCADVVAFAANLTWVFAFHFSQQYHRLGCWGMYLEQAKHR